MKTISEEVRLLEDKAQRLEEENERLRKDSEELAQIRGLIIVNFKPPALPSKYPDRRVIIWEKETDLSDFSVYDLSIIVFAGLLDIVEKNKPK